MYIVKSSVYSLNNPIVKTPLSETVAVYPPYAQKEKQIYSETVVFHGEYAKVPHIQGEQLTIGQAMAKTRYVGHHNDPRLSITSVSRQVYNERIVHLCVYPLQQLVYLLSIPPARTLP
jgi:hypothetical protein